MAEISYRYAEVADAPAVRTLIERAYRGEEAGTGWASEAELLKGPRTSLEEIAALIADEDCRILLAEADSALMACALLEKRGDSAYFGMFAIDPKRQGGGIGKKVVARMEQAVRELWQARALTMVVISLRHELIQWYQRRGYQLSGRREPFPFTDTTGEVHRDFHLVELRKEF